MKKSSILASLLLFVTVSVFAADVDKYMADLDPAKDEKTIITAADWMRDKKESKAVSKLVALLSDSRDMVRLHAVMALGYIDKEDALDAIHRVVLNDTNASVRYTAILSVMRIGSDKSKSTLEQAKLQETDPVAKDLLEKLEKKSKEK
jgi:HEAT repeat protein